jgi:hypothetical protein
MRLGLATALTALLVGLAAFLVTSPALPDLEVRTIPWTTPAGGLQAAAPPCQVFTCERDGLRRIDVAVTPVEPAQPENLELVLRADGPSGEGVRTVVARAFDPGPWGGWLRFEFEPLADSSGKRFAFELRPAGGAPASHVAPFVRYRGHMGRGKWQGEQRLSGIVEGEILCEEPDLRALGFCLPHLEGRVALTLIDAESGADLRSASFEARAPIEFGWVLLSFERLRDSRWRRYRYRLELPPGAELLADEKGACYFPFHGSGTVDARLGGMTLGGRELGDRDLNFRAWSDAGPSVAWGLLRERLGWRLAPIALAWLAASALLGFAVGRGRR